MRGQLGMLGMGGPAMLGDDPVLDMGQPLAPVAIPPRPVAPPPAPEPMPKVGGGGVGGFLDEILFDGALGKRKAGREDRALALQQLAQRRAVASRLFPNDEQAQYLFATGNGEFMKSIADRYEDKPVAKGGDIVRNGERAYHNPDITSGVDGGQTYSIVDGVPKWGPKREKSYAEENTAEANDVRDKLADIRDRLGQAGIDLRRDQGNRRLDQGDRRLDQGDTRLDQTDPSKRPPSANTELGKIMSKVATSGLESLTTGEAAIWQRYKDGPTNGGFNFGAPATAPAAAAAASEAAGEPAAAPAPAPSHAAIPKGPSGLPRPRTAAELQASVAIGGMYEVVGADGRPRVMKRTR
jgi:hypothetical protein